jgi:hypothetical protein
MRHVVFVPLMTLAPAFPESDQFLSPGSVACSGIKEEGSGLVIAREIE